MFIILLKFATNKAAAPDHMPGHKAWLDQGFADGVFLLAGSIRPGQGGTVLAHNTTAAALQDRVAADPFVAENIVSAEILDIDPARADEKLQFLID